jgi:aerobic-type carbon monoxide dehydrogenase small subunit (CoxS/CutS family)
MGRYGLTVNGSRRDVDAPSDTPLLWVLRDRLGLTGTKYGCGVGICGACTVLEKGREVRSCQVAISEAAGRRFTTIEGLSSDGAHRCQRAWIEEDVAQCGYCQPGMILAAAALLDRVPRPTDVEVDAVFDEHVCRCGTYSRIRRAIRRASQSAGESRAERGASETREKEAVR